MLRLSSSSVIDINTGGVVNGLLVFLPGLRERNNGYIVNTASTAGLLVSVRKECESFESVTGLGLSGSERV
jgi:NADP-dependent 3-hydroxy acid dehydrogenase YdfG